MAITFIACRRVDDHSRTAPIAESALRHLPDWEPIPTGPDAKNPDGADVAENPGESPTPDPNAAGVEHPPAPEPSTRSKSRSRAATDPKE